MPLPGEGDCRPRLCTLRKWDHFPGYGFNLQAEKGKPGQFIGFVDTKSPADACGLKKNDRVIEVNGVNVCNETHKQVVARIRDNPDEVSLLVMDPVTEKHFLENGIVVKGSMDIVEKHEVSAAGSASNGVTAVSEPQPPAIPEYIPEEQNDNQEDQTAEETVPTTEAPAEQDEAELVKETQELNVQEINEEVPVEEQKEEEVPKEEEAAADITKEENVEEEEKTAEEAPTEEAPTEEPTEAPAEEPAEAPTEEPAEAPTEEPAEEAPAEEEVKPIPVSEDNATFIAPVSNSGDAEDKTPADNNATAAVPAPVSVSESVPSEAASSSVNGNNHSADPMSIFQKPASEVRAMHGRSKRRAIKETNQTFKEKYLMFESL